MKRSYIIPKNGLIFHFLAIITSCIWGTTFASTKILIAQGLSPAEIMCTRFIIAYIGIWIIMPSRLFAYTIKDELWLIAAGATGGSLYFFAENTALRYTYASNVGVLVATVPLVTAIVSHLLTKDEPFHKGLFYGGGIALLGICLIMLNGQFVLKLNPLGDILTLIAVLFWAFYSLIVKKLKRYSTRFVIRKVFFYGIVTILPTFLYNKSHLYLLTQPSSKILGNILFLGIIASLGCYIAWNHALKKIGVVKCTNYLYLNPITALFTSVYILGEPLTWISLIGSILILGGVLLTEKT